MRLSLGFLLVISLFSMNVFAQQDRAPAATTIKKIVIKGNKKIEKPAIEAKITSKPGTPVRRSKIRNDIQSLFKTGFFYDVQVDQKGSTLIYTVTEKPSITTIDFKGNSEVDDDELRETVDIKTYEFLNISKVIEAVEKLEKLYEEQGFFLARISYDMEEQEDGNVKLVFNIKENEQVKVKQIRILGNKHLSDEKLKGLIRTQEGGFFSFMGSSDAFQKDVFDQDVRILNFLYYNEGYIQAKIDRPQVYVTPDKKSIYITIRVDEGEQFEVGGIEFAGELMFNDEELREKLTLKEGQTFSYQQLQADLRMLQAKYGDLGYAYANPIPNTRPDPAAKKIYITYDIEKGQKVKINKINVVGNTRTRDKVVRRELKIKEGELYNETKKRKSEASVQRLGYFDEVVFSTSTPDGREDLLDIDIIVKERNTGSLQVGAGYGQAQGFVFMGQLNETNLFGKGQKVGLNIQSNKQKLDFSLQLTEPYFRDTNWSVGVDAYHNDGDTTEYKQKKTGGAFRVGHPIAEYTYGYLRYKVDHTQVDLFDPSEGLPGKMFPVDTVNGQTNSVTATITYDERNDRFMPSNGLYSSVSLEYAGLFGGISYTKGVANLRYYKKVVWDLVWRNNLVLGVVDANKKGEEPPFTQLFLLGGPNTLRGYYYLTVGERRRSQTAFDAAVTGGKSNADAEVLAMRPFGGKQQIYYNMEFMFPLVDAQKVFGVFFYDVGEARDNLSEIDFKSDVGFGFRWISPLGPLRFEWGFPINPDETYHPDEMFFNFNIGTPF